MDVRIAVTIEGMSPLLMNRFQLPEIEDKEKSGGKVNAHPRNETPRDTATKCLYLDEGGTIVMPGVNLFASIMQAGIYFKDGKRQWSTGSGSHLPGVCGIEEIHVPIIHKNWEVDSRPVKIPSTGGRIVRYRPRFDQWKLKYHLYFDKDLIDMNVLRNIVDAAGKRVGLGDFRPSCKGVFGKSVVTSWKRLKR